MAGVLDTDVATLLPLLRRGLEWWLGELADLARPLIRERGIRGLRTMAVRQADGRYALVRDGVPAGFAGGGRPVEAAVLMPAELTLVRETAVAGLSRRDGLRLVENDIDRLTPFAPSEVYAAIRILPSEAGRQTAQLAVAPRRHAGAVLRSARQGGVRAAALLVEAPSGGGIDLLPALRAAGALGRARPGRRAWLAVAALVALNVGAAVWRDVRDTDRLQAAVDRQQPVVRRIVALRRQVADEQGRRRTLLARRIERAPLRALATATRALPDGAWVQRLAYEDGELRLTGYHRPGLDVLAALQADPGLTGVRSAAADLAASGATPALGEPFDLVATSPRPSARARP